MGNPIKLKAEVTSITPHGAGTYEVRFAPQGPAPRFKAGQFLHLTVDDYDPAGGFWPESRVFSIASAPGAPELEIVYSVKGRYTRRMEGVLRPGLEVWLKLPYGSFIIESSTAQGQDLVLIAGGTGISPYLPYLRKLAEAGSASSRPRLYYGIRENAMFLAGELLDRGCGAGSFEASLFVENEEPGEGLPKSAARERGRLDIDRIFRESAGLRDPVFFLSGPPAMISAFKAKLGGYGVGPDRIRIDEWE